MYDVMDYVGLANIYEKKECIIDEKNKYIIKKLIVPVVFGIPLIMMMEVLLLYQVKLPEKKFLILSIVILHLKLLAN